MKRLIVFVLLTPLYTACDDADHAETNSDIPKAVNYHSPAAIIAEDLASHEVVILLSEVAEKDGSLEVLIEIDEAEYGDYFTTEPAALNGKISLAIAAGDTEVSFNILPVNNTKLNGNKTAAFSLISATGSIRLGKSRHYALTIVDDELVNKPQTLVINSSGMAQSKRTYEYNVDGQVSKIYWEAKNPFGTTQGTDEYFYNEAGGIILISRGTAETKYTWENGFIVKSEQKQNDEVVHYYVYEYNESGNVKKAENFIRKASGEFSPNFYTTYTYHEDGNVHKQINYMYEEGEFVLSSTFTYEEYIEGHNAFPLVQILPTQKDQAKLPTYYSHETQDAFLEYHIAYEFTEEGYPTKREITGAVAGSGVATFTYY
jgi:hypothetical protein